MGHSSSAFVYVMSIFFLLYICRINGEMQVFNIMQFGAVADGVTDNSKALSSAWSQACQFEGSSEVLVPTGKFLVLPLMLQGPCTGSIQLQIEGDLVASADPSYATGMHWLAIHRVSNLVLDGGGVLDGQGTSAWQFNNCSSSSSCPTLPSSLKFSYINTATVRNITSLNSKGPHFQMDNCHSITMDHISITAPADSPNTDGFDIDVSTNITLLSSTIATGDDCISLGPGVTDVNITGVHCGPGHGISIGSLGRADGEPDVTGITVQSSIFEGSRNGVRIKTWATPYRSVVKNVLFLHLTMNGVQNPIIVDQSYCPHSLCGSSPESGSHVKIEGVRYQDISGTSMTREAVQFNCSQITPCEDIELQDIDLVYSGSKGSEIAICNNVQGSASGQEIPASCF